MRTMLPVYLHRGVCAAFIGLLAACASPPVARQDLVPDVPLERPTAAPSSPLPASAYVWSDPIAAAASRDARRLDIVIGERAAPMR